MKALSPPWDASVRGAAYAPALSPPGLRARSLRAAFELALVAAVFGTAAAILGGM